MEKLCGEYRILDKTSERISILKLWLSIMVVFIHSAGNHVNFTGGTIRFDVPVWLETLKFIVSGAISNCAVPAFFFLSAIFLYKSPFTWKENCRKKFVTLFIPYIIMNTLWIVLFAAGQALPFLSSFFANPNNIVANWDIIRWLKAYGIVNNKAANIYPILYPLWFVRDLIVVNIFAVAYKKVIDLSPKFFGVVLLVLWLFPVPIYWVNYLLNKQTICFWGFGYLFVYYGIGLEKLDNYKKYIVMLYPVCIFLDCIMRGTTGGAVMQAFCCMVGIAFWFVGFTTFREGKIRDYILYFSSFSFFIYLFHENTLTCVKKVCYRILPASSAVQALAYIVIPFFIVGGCVLFGHLLREKVPSVYRVLVGNRVR